MQQFLSGPGFLGTGAPLVSDLALVFMLISAVMLTVGWRLARLGRYRAHRWVQTAAVVVTSVVALGFMVKSFLTHILPGIPAHLLEDDYGVSTLHSILGTLAVLLGVFIVLRTNNLVPPGVRFSNYKPIMRIAYASYMLATLLGIAVYILVFVLGI